PFNIVYSWYTPGAVVNNHLDSLNGYVNFSYPNSGKFKVAFVGQTNQGCRQEFSDSIRVKATLPAPIIQGPASLCGNTDTAYSIQNVSSFPSNAQFHWSIKSEFYYFKNIGFLNADTGRSVRVHLGDIPGVDTLLLTNVSAEGYCVSSAIGKKVVTSNPLPLNQIDRRGNLEVKPNYTNGKYCAQQILQVLPIFQISPVLNRVGVPIAINTVNWDTPSATLLSSNSDSISITYPMAGNYTVTYDVTNNFGCDQKWTTIIELDSTFSNPILFGPDSLCGNMDTSYSVANASNFPKGTKFKWDIKPHGNTNIQILDTLNGGTKIKVKFNSYAGFDTINLSVQLPGYCKNEASKVVFTKPVPLSNGSNYIFKSSYGIPNGNFNYCHPIYLYVSKDNNSLPLQRDGVPNEITSYSWKIDGADIIEAVNDSSRVFQYPDFGKKLVMVSDTNNFGCSNKLEFDLNAFLHTGCASFIDSLSFYNLLGVTNVIKKDTIDGLFSSSIIEFGGNTAFYKDLVLKNGTFKLSKGNSIYGLTNCVLPRIVLDSATLIVNNGILTSLDCAPIWDGVYLANNSKLLVTGTNDSLSYFKYAWMGVGNLEYNDSYVNISNTRFINNSNAIVLSAYSSVTVDSNSIVKNSEFIYDNNLPNSWNGLRHVYLGGINNKNFIVKDNIFKGGAYNGIYSAGSEIIGNTFTDMAISVYNLGGSKVTSNTITVPKIENGASYGVYSDGGSIMTNNLITSDSSLLTNNSSTKGVFVLNWSSTNLVSNNSINNLDYGIQTNSYTLADYKIPNTSAVFSGNKLRNNTNGFYNSEDPYHLGTVDIKCNSFITDGVQTRHGVVVASDGYMNDLGNASSPLGNKFTGFTGASYCIRNEGNDFTYYLGPNEALPNIGGFGVVNLPRAISDPSCASQGFQNGVGRIASMESPSSEDIAQIQDSLRFQVGTLGRQKQYQTAIIKYYVDNSIPNQLYAYAGSLIQCNREAYYTFLFYLMEYYAKQGQSSLAKVCKEHLLLPDPSDKEILARTRFFEYNQRPRTTVPIPSKPTMVNGKISGPNLSAPFGSMGVKDSTDL
ncbi:MAG: hypothetical protein K2Q22_10675, partial [Cytophagales bacterium]|nr:hypothetical protein [Cytophagales bacterium]